MYVIVRVSDGVFVAPSGSGCSYTVKLQDARTFPTREAAERERCQENETVRHVSDIMAHNGR